MAPYAYLNLESSTIVDNNKTKILDPGNAHRNWTTIFGNLFTKPASPLPPGYFEAERDEAERIRRGRSAEAERVRRDAAEAERVLLAEVAEAERIRRGRYAAAEAHRVRLADLRFEEENFKQFLADENAEKRKKAQAESYRQADEDRVQAKKNQRNQMYKGKSKRKQKSKRKY